MNNHTDIGSIPPTFKHEPASPNTGQISHHSHPGRNEKKVTERARRAGQSRDTQVTSRGLVCPVSL